MKTHDIELQRLKGALNRQDFIDLQVDATVTPSKPRDDREPTSILRMTEETARVLVALLRAQLQELDKRKGRSQR